MKKLHFSLIVAFIAIASVTIAQEANDTLFKMAVGDTVVWKPFNNCDNLGYSVKGANVISYKPVKLGDQIQVIAEKVGNSSITAKCIDNDTKVKAHFTIFDPEDLRIAVEKPVKPATLPFTSTYRFNPPSNYFFITINDEGTKFNETYMKHGDDEAFNDGQGIDRFWNVKTGKNWYYKPDAQGWTDDVDWEFEAFGESFPIINSFATEVNKGDLSNYYVGTEKLTVGSSEKPKDIDCWKFFVDFEDGTVIQYWVDPANGCTLKRKINADPAKVVTVYDLKYNRLYFGPSFKKGLHDTTR